MKIKVGDQVIVTTGKDKGKSGKVLQVVPKKQSVVVEGISIVVKHRKPMMGRSGERVTIQKPISISKVAITNQAGEPDRVGYQLNKDGSKTRVLRKSGEKPNENTSTKSEAKKDNEPAKKTVAAKPKKAKSK